MPVVGEMCLQSARNYRKWVLPTEANGKTYPQYKLKSNLKYIYAPDYITSL